MTMDQLDRLGEISRLVLKIGTKTRRALSSIELLMFEMGPSSDGDWGAAIMKIEDKVIEIEEALPAVLEEVRNAQVAWVRDQMAWRKAVDDASNKAED